MKKLIVLFFILPICLCAQDLELYKATVQTINHGASPTSSTNYLLLLKKTKLFKWSIDSIYTTADNKRVNYNIVKVDNYDAVSPTYEQLKNFEKKYRGIIQITFASMKSMGEGRGRPNSPKVEIVEQNDYSTGIVLYYTYKKKKKSKIIPIQKFEKLETINAP